MKLSGGVMYAPRKYPSHLGTDTDQGLDQGICFTFFNMLLGLGGGLVSS